MSNIAEETQINVQIETDEFICPNCNGIMKHDIAKKTFKCSSCGSEQDIVPSMDSIKEYSFAEYNARENNSQSFTGMSVVRCNTCGGEIIFEEHDTATICPMCGSSQVATQKQTGGIPPEGIIPFAVDKNQAQSKFGNWVKSRWFAPNKLKKMYQEGKLTGIYIPFWTYDTSATGMYTGRGGKRYTAEVDGKKVTKIRWTAVSGHVSRFFDDLQICASKTEGEGIISGVLPFSTTTKLIPYAPQYLSGYKAEHYSVKADEGFESAKSIIEDSLDSKAKTQILHSGYDEASISTMQIRYSNVTYKHVLLPIWSAVFTYSGKKYKYIINGETGKVDGQRPYSAPKIIAAIIVAIAIVGAIVMLYADDATQTDASVNINQTVAEYRIKENTTTSYKNKIEI